MTESQEAKANRLEKAREQRRVKREQTGSISADRYCFPVVPALRAACPRA